MTALLFLFVLAAAFISLAVCIIRLFISVIRNKGYGKVTINFAITCGLFITAANLACTGLGL